MPCGGPVPVRVIVETTGGSVCTQSVDLTPSESTPYSGPLTIVVSPEYPGAVMSASGSDNDAGEEGMTSDSEMVGGLMRNYYEWSSDLETGLQSYDILFQVPIPYNFTGFQVVAKPVSVDIKTEENAATNNKIDVTINRDGIALYSSLVGQKSSSAAAWETVGFPPGDPVLAAVQAGENLNVAIRMYSQFSKYARVGKISLQIMVR